MRKNIYSICIHMHNLFFKEIHILSVILDARRTVSLSLSINQCLIIV
uniref:Uncharacterized protein n=1 Tax=Arundo donax TaxID=35708 RepID=A0A0A9B5A7_ARUDO